MLAGVDEEELLGCADVKTAEDDTALLCCVTTGVDEELELLAC